jgi:phytanoyl-CoA hydroxylase
MHFSDDEIGSYKANGFVAGPRVLTDQEIEELRNRIDGILSGSVPFPPDLLGETVEKSKAKGQLPSVKIVNLFRHDSVFARIMHNQAISSLAHDLMEGPVRLWEDQMIYKPRYDQVNSLAWHQDDPYWTQVGPPELATCWIALDDATLDNGCMRVISGSHKWPVYYSREEVDVRDPEWLLKRPDIPKGASLEQFPCEVKAGHCHFHHCLTFHGSYGNKTGNPRRSYILHLMPGTTRRIGNSWNSRQGSVEEVSLGEIVRGPSYPDLPVPV